MAQKFTTGITVRDLASAASDAVAVSVAGDTNDRIKFEAGGKVVWGSGAAAGDVNLYRDAADRLKTDDALQADGGIITVTTAGTPTLSLPDGALAIDTTNNLLYIRTNSTWEIASGGGGASVTTSDGAPADPESGDLWYETDTGSMFVYYDDGDSQQWVEVGTAGVIAMTTSDTAPSTPSGGDLWFDTSTAKTYVYYAEDTSSQWVEIGAASAASHGEDGYIQFATGGTFNSDSALVWDDTNSRLGIGTTTPSQTLDVRSANDNTSVFQHTTNGSDARIELRAPEAGGTSRAGQVFFDPDANFVGFRNGNINAMGVDSSGNVGIGTTSPESFLHLAPGTNVTPNAEGVGHLMIDGAGYTGFASLDGTAMWVGHNSGSRNLYLATNETAQVTVTGGGNVGIGNTGPTEKLQVAGNIRIDGDLTIEGYSNASQPSGNILSYASSSVAAWSSGCTSDGTRNHMRFSSPSYPAIGAIYTSSGNTYYANYSDYRLKDNVAPLANAGDIVTSLNPVSYTMRYSPEVTHLGFLAHELQEHIPSAVGGQKDEVDEEGNPVYQNVDLSKVVPVLTAALQEALSTITDLTARIEALEAN